MKTILYILITLSAALLLGGCQGTETIVEESVNVASEQTIKNPTEAVDKSQQAGWYMRTRVSATTADGTVYGHNSAGVFGELQESQIGKDRHDIAAYGAATLQVVFPHYDWPEGEAGDYWSDYHRYIVGNTQEHAAWAFQIKNQQTVDLSNTNIEIKLDDAIKVNYSQKEGSSSYKESGIDRTIKGNFTLVDVDNQQTYQVDELQNANLTMDGNHTRTFRWVRGTVEEADYSPVRLP